MRAGDEENRSLSRVGLVSDPLYRPEPTLRGLGASSIGVAVFNRQIRFCAINHTLASFNRVPAEAHLGKSLDPIIGKLANVVGERIELVLHTGQAVTGFEVSGKLPRRPDIGYCLKITSRSSMKADESRMYARSLSSLHTKKEWSSYCETVG
jgi:hypothetical protein